MLVDVTLLRAKGVRLRKGELPAPARGHLVIEDDPGTASSFKRPVRVAHLYHAIGVQQTRQDLLLPIFDAVVIRIEAEVITITGTELASDGDRVAENGQVWRCALVRE
jgi:hypothetical protein